MPTALKMHQAQIDVTEIATFIAADNLDAAIRFLEAFESAIARLAERPHPGRTRRFRDEALQGVRVWVITGFENYIIFYMPVDDGIEVLRVIHGGRDIDVLLDSGEDAAQ